MPTEFRLPELGEGIAEADVIRVLVHEGDTITVGQAVATIETEKATVDVPSEVAGTVTSIAVKEGQTVSPGTVILAVDAVAPAQAAPAAPTPEAQPAAATPAPTPEPVSQPAPTQPVPAPAPAAEPRAPQPETPEPAAAASTPAQPATPPPAPAAPSGAFAAPSVRLFAREIGIDIATVTGSGPGGGIDIEDVKRHAREHASGGTSASSHTSPQLPDFSAFGPVSREPLSRFRRTVARNIATSATEIPQVTLFASADIGAFEAVRRAHRDEASKAGGTITNLVILVKLIALALREFPHFNASIDMQADELVLKDYVHVGLAVDTDRGLAVSVFRDADKKSLAELAVDLKGIIERSKANTMTIEEMRGSTFTISTLESMGIGHFTPLVNWPEVAILGVGRGTDLPSYENDELHARRRWALSLSLDHRVVDGADGARFLSWLVNAIQQPTMLDTGDAS